MSELSTEQKIMNSAFTIDLSNVSDDHQKLRALALEYATRAPWMPLHQIQLADVYYTFLFKGPAEAKEEYAKYFPRHT